MSLMTYFLKNFTYVKYTKNSRPAFGSWGLISLPVYQKQFLLIPAMYMCKIRKIKIIIGKTLKDTGSQKYLRSK